MTALLQIINNPDKDYDKKVIELQNYLKDNSEIVINKQLFALAISNPSYGLAKAIKLRNRRLF